MDNIIIIISIATTGLLFTLAGTRILPIFKKKLINISILIIGIICLIGASGWAIQLLIPKPESGKRYNLPLITSWYFVNPNECKKAIIDNTAFTPKKFAKQNECETQTSPSRPGLVMLDCRKMLNDVLYMVEGDAQCSQMQMKMQTAFQAWQENQDNEKDSGNKKAEQ